MALNSLNLGTDGAIKRGATKAILVLGVAGMLYFGGTPPNPPSPPSGGGGGYTTTETHKHNEQEERRKRILIEDSILVQIVEITLKTTII